MLVGFTGAESAFGYFEVLREYLERYGKPPALYSVCAPLQAILSGTPG